MNDFQLVRTQTIGFGQHGAEGGTEDIFIKILAGFQSQLIRLPGARLHVFMAVATQEAEIITHNAPPLSLRKMEKVVPYSRPTIAAALDYLVEDRFILELADRGPQGEKLYRVCQYAWFGTKAGDAAFHPASVVDVPTQPADAENETADRGGKEILPPPRPSGLGENQAQNEGSKKSLPPPKDFSLEEEGDCSSLDSRNQSSSTTSAGVKKILAGAGMFGEDLERLAASVSEDHAREIAEWIRGERDDPDSRFRSPAGIARCRLLANPEWLPDRPKKKHRGAWWSEQDDQFVNR